MAKKIGIVIDVSGSMAEDDKNAVVKYVINTICNIRNNEVYSDIEFVFYSLGNEAKEISDIEKEKLIFVGRVSEKSVEQLSVLVKDNIGLVLLSDGNYEAGIRNKFMDLKAPIIPVYIGMDAKISCLEWISLTKTAYAVTDVIQAINNAM